MELDWIAGFLAGLSSSAHCLAMCGGIAAALAVSTPRPAGGGPAQAFAPAGALFQAMAGRISMYALIGLAAGAVGSGFHQLRPGAAPHLLLEYLSAAVLMAAAAAVTGILPQPAWLTRTAGRVIAPAARLARYGPFATGAVWGLTPCPIVYLTTFYAGLTGDALQGALVMTGFGLGSAPALLAAGMGAGALRDLARRPALRWLAAAALAGVAAASLL